MPLIKFSELPALSDIPDKALIHALQDNDNVIIEFSTLVTTVSTALGLGAIRADIQSLNDIYPPPS